jgi:hypothetical protein
MAFGASIFFTDYSITPAELAVALEKRGFDSVWAAEHSHIPVPRKTLAPGGAELHKRYYDVMDPFVTLTATACATKKLKIGTGIALAIQRDTIQAPKLFASIDQMSVSSAVSRWASIRKRLSRSIRNDRAVASASANASCSKYQLCLSARGHRRRCDCSPCPRARLRRSRCSPRCQRRGAPLLREPPRGSRRRARMAGLSR